ncbi:hypothetical protein [Aquimarina aggregata]|uniref:hypothetical protein n=1 Tax=Aquimarina aggregata TaxID=1642818 RepID=UPI0024924FE0|nr:hypothetical protein [Aquimarina aggregata]
MDILKKIFDPVENRKKGMNHWFFLGIMLNSNIRSTQRRIIYVFHICHLIDLKAIDQSELTKEYLLQFIFKLSEGKTVIKKGHIRKLTALNKDTFNAYFDDHLKEIDLYKRRIFTIKETYQILQFWQGNEKWGRMEAYTKRELANLFTQGNYENLAIDMIDNSIFTEQEYYERHYIKPADVKKIADSSIENKEKNLNKFDDNDESNISSLRFFFYFYFLYFYFFKENFKNR